MARKFNIEFSEPPVVKIRVIDKNDSEQVTKSKKKFPFILKNELIVKISEIGADLNFEFKIPRNYIWNGADIPRFLFFMGQSKDNNYLIASMVHDFMIEKREYIYSNILEKSMTGAQYRKLTSLIFREILKDEKTNTIKANCMSFAVDLFQAVVLSKRWKELGGG